MQRRRLLAGVASGVSAGLVGGCMGAGEGKDARRVSVNASATAGASALRSGTTTGTRRTPTPARRDRDLVLFDHEFYREGSSGGVRGTVADRGGVDLDFVAAHTRFFDRNGARLEQSSDTETGFEVGDTWNFDTRLLHTDASRVARYWLVVIDQRTSEVRDPFGKPA